MRAADLQRFVGKEYPPFTLDVEKGRLRLFAKAVGSANPVFTDEAAARSAGFASIPAPPTFGHCLMMDTGQSFQLLAEMEVPMRRAVHGGQSFRYHRPILAGDVITGRMKVDAIHEKKAGALLFIETVTRLENQRGEHVCDLASTVIVRN